MEMQQVMALRLARIAAGGALAQREATLMVTEKIAGPRGKSGIAAEGVRNCRPDRAATRVLALYRRHVKANHRRLSSS